MVLMYIIMFLEYYARKQKQMLNDGILPNLYVFYDKPCYYIIIVYSLRTYV